MTAERKTRLRSQAQVNSSVTIELTGVEIRALHVLTEYGTQPFLEAFYKLMGKSFLQPHAAGIESLFDTIQRDLGPIIRREEVAKQAFALRDPVVVNKDELNARYARWEASGREAGRKEALAEVAERAAALSQEKAR